MATYPDTLVITRPTKGTGSMNASDVYVAGSSTTIYSNGADVQDEPAEVTRDGDGTPTREYDAVAFLKDETKLDLILVDDDALVTFADASTRRGKVTGTRKLDGQVLLKWVA